jgi:polysaccharide export outer membrane protein
MASRGILAFWAVFAVLVGGCANSSNEVARTALTGSEASFGEVTATAKPARAERPAETARTPTEFAAAATPGSHVYKIGPQDVLEISVFKVPELSKSVQVSESGTINLALVGDIEAAGRTAQDIERDLVKRLSVKYLQKPQVTVFVKEYNSQRITVEGAVKKPGVFPYRGRATLLQAVAMAEGLDPVADNSVVVFRTIDGKRSAAKFDISEIRSGAAQDPQIESGDVVVVATSSMKEAFGAILKILPAAGVFATLL